MHSKRHDLAAMFLLSAFSLLPATHLLAQSPALINYQGRLLDGTNLVNGTVGLSLRLFNTPSGGVPLYEDSNSVAVVDGLYATLIGDDPVDPSFLSAFTIPDVWVEVAVNGTTLTPREQIASVGFALTTRGLRVSTNGSAIHNPGVNFSVDDADYATVSGGFLNSIGTNSDYAVVGGGSGNRADGFYATIAGGRANAIGRFSSASTIAGGDENSIGSVSPYTVIAGGQQNVVGANASHALIGGGLSNRVAASEAATVAGGKDNSIEAGSDWATIGGGLENTIMASNTYSTIAGGYWNDIGTNSFGSTIGGGFFNKVGEQSTGSTIAGGGGNRIGDTMFDSTIGGGSANTILSSAWRAVIIGGFKNVIYENGRYATILGGQDNVVGSNATNALAAGRRAMANHQGAFVWADNTDADFASTANNQFLIRASGNVGINETNPVYTLHVNGDVKVGRNIIWTNSSNDRVVTFGDGPFCSIGERGADDRMELRAGAGAGKGFYFTGGNLGLGVIPTTNLIETFDGAKCTGPNGSTWANASDKNLKENFAALDPRVLLEKVVTLPITEWNYKSEGSGVRHVGPMAQDFHAAFGLGGDDVSISTVDASGIAFAAIQALAKENEGLKEQVSGFGVQVSGLEEENRVLRERLEALEKKLGM